MSNRYTGKLFQLFLFSFILFMANGCDYFKSARGSTSCNTYGCASCCNTGYCSQGSMKSKSKNGGVKSKSRSRGGYYNQNNGNCGCCMYDGCNCYEACCCAYGCCVCCTDTACCCCMLGEGDQGGCPMCSCSACPKPRGSGSCSYKSSPRSSYKRKSYQQRRRSNKNNNNNNCYNNQTCTNCNSGWDN